MDPRPQKHRILVLLILYYLVCQGKDAAGILRCRTSQFGRLRSSPLRWPRLRSKCAPRT